MSGILNICPYLKQFSLLSVAILSFFISIAQYPIVIENDLPGNPSSEWDIAGPGDLAIQGFGADISVDKGQTPYLNIKTGAACNPLLTDIARPFTMTAPPPGPNEGPGGPILVISTSTNPFSLYTAEILRAEGLNEFATMDMSAVTSTILNNYDVVVLGEMTVTAPQVTLLTNWVNAGGTLIAFRPGSLLNSLFGISAASGTLSDKYLLVNTSLGPAVGIVNQTIQFHGAADLYTLSGATSLATLYSDASTATTNPAVTTINVGSNGGKAIAFTYDLAKSIIYTRQGNPAWAGTERDGQAPIRSDDMFFGLPANTGADWIDLNKVAIPQADEQQRLLANIIIQNNLHRKPLPRFWYLPRSLKAAIVMTGDDHANNGTVGRFNQYLTLGPNTAQDVADWTAIRGTSYIYPSTPITNAQIVSFQNQGFEIATHPTTSCGNFTPATLESNFSSQLGNFAANFPGAATPVTNRTHCLVWSDWATHPKVELNHGIRFDVNYYYWPASWVQNRPGMFTGSGMPMRFADTDGSMIDVYQATTQMTDESGIGVADFCNAVLDKATGPEGYYGVFTANMHTDTAIHTGSNAIITSALAHQVPVVSAKQMLTWIDGRNNSAFGNITWAGNVLSFTITAASGSTNLRAMLPFSFGNEVVSRITRNDTVMNFTLSIIKGIQYAFFDASGSGNFAATYSGSLPVTLLNISASPNGKKVTLRWSASSEINNRGFDVQRSDDGSTWKSIGYVAGAGNSTITTNYSYVDDNLEARKYYYRLNQTDIDGRSKYSVIVSAVIGSKGEYALGQNYPNPFTNETTIQYTIARPEQVNISLFDMSGRTIKVLVNASKEAGTYAISFHTATLTRGIYYYRIQAGDFTDVKKLTIQ
jgi:hypothetical protein